MARHRLTPRRHEALRNIPGGWWTPIPVGQLGVSQQALIAEGINHVQQKHAKSAVAT